MAKYRKIDPIIWNDRKFNSMTVAGKLAFIFILTHPHMTSVGAMRSSINGLVDELPGVDKKAFMEAFDLGLLKVSSEACLIWAPKFLKYNPPESPNVVKAWATSMDLLPECSMKDEILLTVKDFLEGLSEGFLEGWLKAYGKPWPIQEQEQEQEQEQDNTLLVETKVSTNGNCPYEKIIDLYHTILPELPSVRIMTDKRKGYLKARWNQKVVLKDGTLSNTLEFWEKYFNYIRESRFLMGCIDPAPGRNRFIADFEWITNLSNFTKILENKYHN